MDKPVDSPDAFVLVDNGSLRPAVVSGLRQIASDLEGALGIPVWASSYAHSNRIDSDALGGCPGLLLSDCLEMLAARGARWIGVQPLLLASGSAIYRGVRKTANGFLDGAGGKCRVDVAPALCDDSDVPDLTIAKIIASRVEEAIGGAVAGSQIDVVVVDHGSPYEEVAAVRNQLAADVGQLLPRGLVSRVIPSSMERRPGDEYAFNDPLLEPLLLSLETRSGHMVVVAMAFLQEGRHAGPGGDVAMICERVKIRRPELRLIRTGMIADHPLMLPLLEKRIRARWAPRMGRGSI